MEERKNGVDHVNNKGWVYNHALLMLEQKCLGMFQSIICRLKLNIIMMKNKVFDNESVGGFLWYF